MDYPLHPPGNVHIHRHPHAAGSKLRHLESKVHALEEENLRLRALALHGIVHRLEALATDGRHFNRCAHYFNKADAFRKLWEKAKRRHLLYIRRGIK